MSIKNLLNSFLLKVFILKKKLFFFLTEYLVCDLIHAVAQIAQSVEQGIENPRVGGSIPSLGTISKPNFKKSELLTQNSKIFIG